MSAQATESTPAAPTSSNYGAMGPANVMMNGTTPAAPAQDDGLSRNNGGVENPNVYDPAPPTQLPSESNATTSTELLPDARETMVTPQRVVDGKVHRVHAYGGYKDNGYLSSAEIVDNRDCEKYHSSRLQAEVQKQLEEYTLKYKEEMKALYGEELNLIVRYLMEGYLVNFHLSKKAREYLQVILFSFQEIPAVLKGIFTFSRSFLELGEMNQPLVKEVCPLHVYLPNSFGKKIQSVEVILIQSKEVHAMFEVILRFRRRAPEYLQVILFYLKEIPAVLEGIFTFSRVVR
ncbi:unnamed protein product [Symbiodinium sp. CCMP2592]|nr:unnamed protein product [Symbiodinium sp. CCMP2592]